TGDVMIRLASKPDHLFIPSVSVMMESVLSVYGARTVGVIMTGMGNDGADAMVNIRKAGGITIAESEESAIVFGMPGETVKRGGAEIVVPIWNIAAEIIKAVNR
ncbi:MAG: CheB methylesterase domain-containing protein, partial [Syntrophomonadaceae bacterium]